MFVLQRTRRVAWTLPRTLLFKKLYSKGHDTFLQGAAGNYIDSMFKAWKENPTSVHVSWQAYFSNIQGNVPPSEAFTAPPSSLLNGIQFPGVTGGSLPVRGASLKLESGSDIVKEILDHMKVQLLVRAYQVRGHHKAKLDPLGILSPDLDIIPAPELDITHYGFTEADLSRSFYLGQGILHGFRSENTQTLTLREIVTKLKETYCGNIGFEYTHLPDRTQCDWIRSKIEIPTKFNFTKDEKFKILDRLIWSDSFERFVQTKYPGEKRFGLEGCESLIPGMKALIDRSVESGVEEIVMGMPHRGRLNVLSNVVRKPNESIFCEFNGKVEPTPLEGSGDVKYHLGMNYVRSTPSGKTVHLSLVANPSHLEAVNPVVQGKVRALQFYKKDLAKEKVMGILLHGDASFAGQGVVYESLGLCDLQSYSTGGTIHIIVNNQIGFTTDPRFSRSTPYCSDIAKSINAPILHVNGDDVEAVVFACVFASDWRKTYKRDIVLDIVCYRRHGHNEFDEPMFTQPRMYKAISKKTRSVDLYIEQLKKEKIFSEEKIQETKQKVWQTLEQSYQKSKQYTPTSREWVSSTWNGFRSPKEMADYIAPVYDTGVDKETLAHVGNTISSYPQEFDIHKGLARILEARKKTLQSGQGIDMPTAESLAFGTLLLEGNHVRLSGQDVERGTFSQRHAVLHDQTSEKQYIPLQQLSPSQAAFTVSNSSLSEYGILGFELGYSLVDPRCLILWEAQYGDFCNNAQCIIDQFIAGGEKKWHQRTGLGLLLPHGYDGAGPEHSSARLERFLQLCDDNPYVMPDMSPEKRRQVQDCNMQVVYCSTPANYFHVLRRQVHRDFRKPIILINSKNLMRHALARSSIADFERGTRFVRLYGDSTIKNKAKVKRVVVCSGQVYYALFRAREQNKIEDVAIVRVEQISPFPFDLLAKEIDNYPSADIVWCQEEPLNMGPWTYVEPRITTAMKATKAFSNKRVGVVSREPTAAVATGNKLQHIQEEQKILSEALLGKFVKPASVANGVPVWNK